MQRRPIDPGQFIARLRDWAQELGFQQLGVSDTNLANAEARLSQWLQLGYHGDMAYLERHGLRRSRPAELVPGTRSVIMARMDHLPRESRPPLDRLRDRDRAYIARYALGRDYHKLLRHRLQKLADRMEEAIGPFGYRVFTDSAPVMEKPLAARAGLGWQGKHTNLINRHAGSLFLLGTIYTDLELPTDEAVSDHCGSCTACLDVCPTRAIVAPYQLDARRCISYLTIENRGSIPEALRPQLGNRIFGCDDCQLVCPWNRYAQFSPEPDFQPRHGLDESRLVDLFAWDEDTWRRRTEGSALRRPGYEGWLRNLAVALGNAPARPATRDALLERRSHPSELVREHVDWALRRQSASAASDRRESL